MSKLVMKVCVVCGEDVWWDDDKMPPACGDHTYEQVIDAVEKKRKRKEPTP